MTKGKPHPLTEQILALRGKKSHGVIAKELGVTRNVVAGVCFRADHPGKKKIGSTRVNIPSSRWAKERLPIWPETRHAIGLPD